jgi:hypothetical protein
MIDDGSTMGWMMLGGVKRCIKLVCTDKTKVVIPNVLVIGLILPSFPSRPPSFNRRKVTRPVLTSFSKTMLSSLHNYFRWSS